MNGVGEGERVEKGEGFGECESIGKVMEGGGGWDDGKEKELGESKVWGETRFGEE